MSDTPISDAIKDIPVNQAKIEGSATQKQGAEIHGSIEREKGNFAGGVTGGIGQKTGWTVGGFVRWIWK